MSDDAFRREVLRAHGAAEDELDELLAYTRNEFGAGAAAASFPLPDEPFVAAWEGYAAEAAGGGLVELLRERLPQLRFPVREGVSESEAYRAATRRGEWEPGEPPGGGLRLRRPEEVRLLIHPTPAGRIPVLVAGEREDFVTLVRAFTRRNEPHPVADSMGACMVAGYNNWDRVHELRRAWERENPAGGSAGWAAAFRELLPRRELYQDRFVLLSRGPYSAVPAASLGLSAAEWEELSLRIRLEHECAHYFTRRVFGSMKNALHDELIADSAGIRAALGRFRADWLLRFLGLEGFPEYRAGGRLENYRGTPPLSAGAFRVLQSLVVAAAGALEALDAADASDPASCEGKAGWIRRLASRPLEELAASGPVPAGA